jgi:ABC-2 type transport system permease protein
VLIQAGFYATPILYPVSLIANQTLQQILFLNPMAQSIQGARNVFVTPEAITINDAWQSPIALFIPLGVVFITLLFGILYFKHESKDFAENL